MDPVQQASATGNLVAIDALGPSGEYRTHNREVIRDTAGMPLAELSIVPALYVARTISAQRKVRPLLAAQRDFALGKAADIFITSVIAGMDFDSYVELASRASAANRRDPGGGSRRGRRDQDRNRCGAACSAERRGS